VKTSRIETFSDGAIAILIYVTAIAVAFIYTPLALMMIALPATMYFLPERGIGKFRALDPVSSPVSLCGQWDRALKMCRDNAGL
jgi:hypothetical protein